MDVDENMNGQLRPHFPHQEIGEENQQRIRENQPRIPENQPKIRENQPRLSKLQIYFTDLTSLSIEIACFVKNVCDLMKIFRVCGFTNITYLEITIYLNEIGGGGRVH